MIIDSARSGPTVTTATDHAFVTACDNGELDLPLPGRGSTRRRWAALSNLGERDLALARLAEGHADALAVLADLGAAGQATAGTRWGVWAADPPTARLQAVGGSDGWVLSGLKRYCSGARICTHALVTAFHGDARLLFAVDLADAGLDRNAASWPAIGMAGSDTLDITFAGVNAYLIGDDGAYLRRPGFWHGGGGVAACWFGGARGIARRVLDAGTKLDAHGLAHLGAIDAAITATHGVLERAADEIDDDPEDRTGTARRRAQRVRATVAATAEDVLARAGHALGSTALCHDADHARRAVDLSVYIRQHGAERDLAALGEAAVTDGVQW